MFKLTITTAKDVDHQMDLIVSSFSSRFNDAYRPQHPFESEGHANFSKAMLSNLLGGIGYFHGDSRVDSAHALEYRENTLDFWKTAEEAKARHQAEIKPSNPQELFTMVPSRPFFPRGFLWDEGFHLLVVVDWDLDLALEILASWLSLMDKEGWIAREQILGAEARSKVPPEFQVQYPHYANPPTLFLVIDTFCDMLAEGGNTYRGHVSQYLEDTELGMDFLRGIYPLMKRHYDWFRQSQADDRSYRPPTASQGYRWTGRTMQHTLTSGLDDYPRAQPPHPGELHVDAISWVGMMTSVLANVARLLKEEQEQVIYVQTKRQVMHDMDLLHWATKDNTFCDATINDDGIHKLFCHKGYISLFPFMLDLMEKEKDHLGAILDLIQDPNHLWSPHGLRSLSKTDRYYGKDENYWRGPVWININYLVLKQLLVSDSYMPVIPSVK